MKKFILSLLCLSLFIVGCSADKGNSDKNDDQTVISSESFDEDFYPVLAKKTSNPNRENIYLYSGSTYDYKAIGRGLQVLSLDHFDKDSYYMQEGQYLTTSRCKDILLRRFDANTQPYGLNPELGSTVGGISDAIIVDLLSEQNYLKYVGNEYVLGGISVAIVVYPRVSVNGTRQEVNMSKADLLAYAKTAAERLYSYLRGLKGLEEVPVLIGIYQRSTKDDLRSGKYLGEIYSTNSYGNFEEINQEIVVFPTEASKAIDATNDTAFLQLRSALKEFSVEAVGVVGEGYYTGGKLTRLNITINMNAKTYTEAIAMTQYAAMLVDSRFGDGFYIQVKVESQTQLIAIITQPSGGNVSTVFID